MGLGKTLTMLALILRHRELVAEGEIQDDFDKFKERDDDDDESSDEADNLGWIKKGKKIF